MILLFLNHSTVDRRETIPEILKELNGTIVPPLILGDSAFPFQSWLMKPFTNAVLTPRVDTISKNLDLSIDPAINGRRNRDAIRRQLYMTNCQRVCDNSCQAARIRNALSQLFWEEKQIGSQTRLFQVLKPFPANSVKLNFSALCGDRFLHLKQRTGLGSFDSDDGNAEENVIGNQYLRTCDYFAIIPSFHRTMLVKYATT